MIWLLLFFSAFASVQEGAERWEAGDAAGAIEVWRQTADEGVPSGVLLYDLGVAHYRMGDVPRAIGYWRAARRLRPRDPQLVHNLARGRNQVKGTPEPVPMAAGWMEFLTIGEVGVLGLLVLLAGVVGLGRRRLVGGPRYPWLLLGLVGLVLCGSALRASWAVRHTPAAVVLEPSLLRDTARGDAIAGAELAPGAEVRVVARRGDWMLVATKDGDRGWVPGRSALLLTPTPVDPG